MLIGLEALWLGYAMVITYFVCDYISNILNMRLLLYRNRALQYIY